MAASTILLEKWKQKLLDLGKRNRLLNYRETKRSNLKIIEPDIDVLFSALCSNHILEFILRNPNSKDNDKNIQLTLFELEDNDNKDTNIIQLKPNQVLTDRTDGELIKTLSQIRSKSKLALEEQSINILYVAFGLLSWKESDDSNIELKSPLVLVPVSLILESIMENFKLAMTDDDILLNPTLLFKLERDFGVCLPPLDDYEEHGILKYFEEIQQMVATHGWKVLPESRLGLFSFHKINMYQDLDEHGESIIEHPLIKAFAGDSSELIGLPEELDNFDHDYCTWPINTYQVVDADSSQQDAIVAAKMNVSFVLQGPPGTGKSQTITNIIAECLADDKAILFISEKMAALDVVYKRLKEANLTDFCLQLHSRKANKRDVLAELSRTLGINRTQTRDEALAVLDQLLESRNLLNEYAKSLHTPCDPLKKSVFEIHGRLQQFRHSIDVVFNVAGVGDVTESDINRYRSLLSDFARTASKMGEDYESNPWQDFTGRALTLELRHNLQTRFRALADNLVSLQQNASKYTSTLKLGNINTLAEGKVLAEILSISSRSTKPPVSWFTSERIKPLSEKAQSYLDLSAEYDALRNYLTLRYNPGYFSLPADETALSIKSNITDALSRLNSQIYSSGDSIFASESSLKNDLKTISNYCTRLIDTAGRLSELLELPQHCTLDKIKNLNNLVSLLLSEPRPTELWFDDQKFLVVKNSLSIAKEMHENVASREHELAENFDREIVSSDYQGMLTRFRTEYTSIFKFFKSAYHKDKKTLNALRSKQDKKLSDLQIMDTLLQIKELAEKKDWLKENQRNLLSSLGGWYNDSHTDWDRLSKALINFEKVVAWFAKKDMPPKIKDMLLNPVIVQTEIATINNELEGLLNSIQVELINKTLPANGLSVSNMVLSETKQASDNILSFIELASVPYRGVTAHFKDIKGKYETILNNLEKLSRLQAIESEVSEKGEELKTDYGYYFEGIATDWNAILKSLAWSNEFAETIKKNDLPIAFVELVCSNNESIKESASGASAINSMLFKIDPDYDYLISFFENDYSKYDIGLLSGWLGKCLGDFLALEEWIDFRSTRQKCIEAGLGDYIEKVVSNRVPNNMIVGAFFKRFYRLWLDIMYQRFPAVLNFRRKNHEDLISEFCQLDKNQLNIARARIKELLCQKLPNLNRFTSGKDELGVLMREIHKRKRIMPLRKLFKNIPNLLLSLKPCLMMSPLTVSIFLDPECYKFDVVIFDEASQICTEDAIGAIFRGSQVIIAGDSEQLPPTNFFGNCSAT